MLDDDDLANYYKINFNLMYHHKIDPEIFDRIMPWEREIYLSMLTKKIEEENEIFRQKQAEKRTSGR